MTAIRISPLRGDELFLLSFRAKSAKASIASVKMLTQKKTIYRKLRKFLCFFHNHLIRCMLDCRYSSYEKFLVFITTEKYQKFILSSAARRCWDQWMFWVCSAAATAAVGWWFYAAQSRELLTRVNISARGVEKRI